MECPNCKNEKFKRIIKPINDKRIEDALRRNYYLIDVCLHCGADFGVVDYPVDLEKLEWAIRRVPELPTDENGEIIWAPKLL